MNAKLIAFAIGFASIAAHAAGADETTALGTVSAHASSNLVVACSDATMPSYARVGALLDTNNATVLYAARENMRRTVQHHCMRGVRSVTFALAATATPDPQWVAAVTP